MPADAGGRGDGRRGAEGAGEGGRRRRGRQSARAEALLRWYARSARDLPWRRTRDPYAILVSEVMLQQTQAARVVPRYERFLARFPDAGGARGGAACATCWRPGAGSATTAARWRCRRRRARWRRDGWPARPDDAARASGRYTAAAVASFAWDAQVAAVDTNVRRVIERCDGRRRAARDLAARAGALLPARARRRLGTRR